VTNKVFFASDKSLSVTGKVFDMTDKGLFKTRKVIGTTEKLLSVLEKGFSKPSKITEQPDCRRSGMSTWKG
jgi:hypothetical protein